jgi:hypothetical protein
MKQIVRSLSNVTNGALGNQNPRLSFAAAAPVVLVVRLVVPRASSRPLTDPAFRRVGVGAEIGPGAAGAGAAAPANWRSCPSEAARCSDVNQPLNGCELAEPVLLARRHEDPREPLPSTTDVENLTERIELEWDVQTLLASDAASFRATPAPPVSESSSLTTATDAERLGARSSGRRYASRREGVRTRRLVLSAEVAHPISYEGGSVVEFGVVLTARHACS